MAHLPVLTVADAREYAILKQVAAPVEAIDDDVRKLMDDMAETMYAEFGIGIAAPQVGVLKRIVVMDLKSGEGEADPQFYVNPEITWASEETAGHRRGLPVDPQHLRRGGAPRAGALQVPRFRRRGSRRRGRRPAWRSASSTRSTT
jgi:peptide deformylase